MTETAWDPTGYYAEDCNIARFIDRYGYDGPDGLVPTDTDDLGRIWGDFAEDTGVVWREDYEQVVDLSDGPAFADWYPGGRLNAIETILDQWVERSPDAAMYRWTDEHGREVTVTYAAAARRSGRLANALRDYGIGRGDVVGLVFPLCPPGFIAAMACLRIGATFTMVFPGYGAGAIGHRLDDADARLVIGADGYRRNGDDVDLVAKLDAALERAPTVEAAVLDDHVGIGTDLGNCTRYDWDQFVEGLETTAETAVMASDDPAFIAYSSGTTGAPKGTIHTHPSLLVMGNKEARYHFDLQEGDAICWVTDFGWIIVPIWMLAGAPALGATAVLLEGSPTHPTKDRVWQAIDDFEVTSFGISPTGARTLRRLDESPRESHDLSSLRVIASTGEPWDESGWRWYLEAVGGGEVPVINASGGTELAGAILAPTPTVPLVPGTLYGPAPGVAANIYDDSGTPTDEGYLVVEHPIPGMTNSLTDGDERYLEEYWSTFDRVWNQNDWAVRDENGFWFITGRADDTMNIAGRRITAPAIEEVIADHPAVDEVTIVSVPDDQRGETPVAFVTLLDATAGADLDDEIRSLVDEELGAPFRPSAVHVVEALPRTQTGKVPRDVIRSAYLGEPLGNVDTLDDAGALDSYPQRTG